MIAGGSRGMATAHGVEDGTNNPLRGELSARIVQLHPVFRLLSVGEIARRADAIRQLAQRHAFGPASRLAGGLADALARDGRAAIVRPYLDGMRDAIACDPNDTAAGDALLA